MAVRLAYVEHLEGANGTQLPLFLDEVLANSDDARAHAIIDAIKIMAGTGRQIFYFTAPQDEVTKWQRLGPEGIQIIDLAEVRSLERLSQTPLPTRNYTRTLVPEPGHESILAYVRRLPGAAGPSLWTPLDQQHAWLVFAEGEETKLFSMLQGGLTTIGQLKNYLALQTGPEPMRLSNTIEILEEAQLQLQAARPRPLTPSDLEQANISRFGDMTNVVAVLRDCGNDPRRLMETAIPGVGGTKRESLREWLQKGGYLLESYEPMEEIIARLKGRFSSILSLAENGWVAIERFVREAGKPG